MILSCLISGIIGFLVRIIMIHHDLLGHVTSFTWLGFSCGASLLHLSIKTTISYLLSEGIEQDRSFLGINYGKREKTFDNTGSEKNSWKEIKNTFAMAGRRKRPIVLHHIRDGDNTVNPENNRPKRKNKGNYTLKLNEEQRKERLHSRNLLKERFEQRKKDISEGKLKPLKTLKELEAETTELIEKNRPKTKQYVDAYFCPKERRLKLPLYRGNRLDCENITPRRTNFLGLSAELNWRERNTQVITVNPENPNLADPKLERVLLQRHRNFEKSLNDPALIKLMSTAITDEEYKELGDKDKALYNRCDEAKFWYLRPKVGTVVSIPCTVSYTNNPYTYYTSSKVDNNNVLIPHRMDESDRIARDELLNMRVTEENKEEISKRFGTEVFMNTDLKKDFMDFYILFATQEVMPINELRIVDLLKINPCTLFPDNFKIVGIRDINLLVPYIGIQFRFMSIDQINYRLAWCRSAGFFVDNKEMFIMKYPYLKDYYEQFKAYYLKLKLEATVRNKYIKVYENYGNNSPPQVIERVKEYAYIESTWNNILKNHGQKLFDNYLLFRYNNSNEKWVYNPKGDDMWKRLYVTPKDDVPFIMTKPNIRS